MSRPLLYALIGAFVVAYAAFARWTWSRFWRHGADAWELLVYDRGVRRFGVLMWFCLGFVFPPVHAWNQGLPILSLQTLRTALAELAFGGPICLWMGYL